MADKQLAFCTSVSSFLGLARMNSPEWAYALGGSLGSMICGSFSAIFSYILSAVLSVYYARDADAGAGLHRARATRRDAVHEAHHAP